LHGTVFYVSFSVIYAKFVLENEKKKIQLKDVMWNKQIREKRLRYSHLHLTGEISVTGDRAGTRMTMREVRCRGLWPLRLDWVTGQVQGYNVGILQRSDWLWI
jgi:hypothetical protein